MSNTLEMLRRRLGGPLPGLGAQLRMAPLPRTAPEPGLASEDMQPAAALVLIYPHGGSWHLPLTVRGSQLRHHTGQVSLPGGRVDPGESAEETALREAHEEVGVAPATVELLGRLTPLRIDASGHLLYPVVGLARRRPSFRLAADEVERLIEVPIARLRQPQAIKWEQRERSRPPLGIMDVPYFDVGDARVWGATAMVLAELIDLLGDEDG